MFFSNIKCFQILLFYGGVIIECLTRYWNRSNQEMNNNIKKKMYERVRIPYGNRFKMIIKIITKRKQTKLVDFVANHLSYWPFSKRKRKFKTRSLLLLTFVRHVTSLFKGGRFEFHSAKTSNIRNYPFYPYFMFFM